MKHLLKLLDLTGEEIIDILNQADQLKYENKHGIEHPYLKGKCLGMIFEKSSTRTRVSFEVGINQLGGYAVVLGAQGSQIGRGEPVQDTARVLSRYVDGIMIRTFDQAEVEALAQYGSVPVINGLTDFCHPCQVLADLMTIREVKGSLEGLKLCFIGDGNNMMNSLIVGGLKVGMSVSVACPQGYRPPQEILEFAAGYGDKFELTDSPLQAAKDADVVITDVWTSMGQEEERQKREAQAAGDFFRKLVEEVGEVSRAISHRQFRQPGQPIKGTLDEELWDVIYYTLCLAEFYGIDMEAAIREKEALNNQRFHDAHPFQAGR